MRNKSTDTLLNQLLKNNDLTNFVNEVNPSVDSRSFVELLNLELNNKGLSPAFIVSKTNLSKSHIYKIFSGDRIPSRVKLLQITITISCDLKTTQSLLKYVGLAQLYVKNKRDCIIIYAINNSLSLFETDQLLLNYQQKPLQDDC